jgi:hypothetical protein
VAALGTCYIDRPTDMLDRLLIHTFAAGAAPHGSTVTSAALSLGTGRWIAWALPLLAALAVAVVWSYRRAAPGRLALAMAGLRAAVLAWLLLALLDPSVRLTVRTPSRRSVLVLIDDSASMALRDARSADADVRRALIAQDVLDPAKGLDQPLPPTTQPTRPSRVELVRAALANRRMDLLARLGRDADVRLSAFGRTGGIAELTSPDALTAAGPSTPLGDALRDTLDRARGQATAAVVLVTDGQSNAGSSPLAAAAAAGSAGVPLLIYGVGLSDARDIVVSDLFAPDVAFVDDDVAATVRVRGVGLAGQVGHLVLRLGDKVADERDVTFTGGEQAITLRAKPTKPGTYDLSASIAPRADEATTDNNSATTRLRVVDGKLKVLLVDGDPRWEFKYLQAALLRDRRVSLKCLLRSADAGVSADPASPYVAAFPATRADLFDHYDLVILGDVAPASLSAEQQAMLVQFVGDFGGGLLVVPGKRFGIAGYASTPLGKLLPVDPATGRAAGGARPIPLRRTPAGLRSPTLKLADDPRASEQAWASLPPIYWDLPAAPRPGAESLLVDPSDDKLAVMAVQPYGRGQAMYVGTDNTWRWRQGVGDRVYATFWGQVVQRLALPHLLGESRHAQVATDRPTYGVGDRVTITARVYGGGFAPLADPAVPGTVTVAGHATPLSLSAVADEPGVYRSEFVATAPGEFTFALDRDAKATAAWTVAATSRELAATSMNEPLLREMAAASGGAFYREEDLIRLPDAVKPRAADAAESVVDVALWSTPAYLLLMLAVATAEWVLRKVAQLR